MRLEVSRPKEDKTGGGAREGSLTARRLTKTPSVVGLQSRWDNLLCVDIRLNSG